LWPSLAGPQIALVQQLLHEQINLPVRWCRHGFIEEFARSWAAKVKFSAQVLLCGVIFLDRSYQLHALVGLTDRRSQLFAKIQDCTSFSLNRVPGEGLLELGGIVEVRPWSFGWRLDLGKRQRASCLERSICRYGITRSQLLFPLTRKEQD